MEDKWRERHYIALYDRMEKERGKEVSRGTMEGHTRTMMKKEQDTERTDTAGQRGQRVTSPVNSQY